MRVTIYLSSIQESPINTRELRSTHTHCLLGLVSEGGLLLWDRRSRMQHALSVEEIIALFPVEKVQAALQKRLGQEMGKQVVV